MARTNLPLSTFTAESTTGFADPAGTAIDHTNGMNIAIQSSAIPAVSDASMLVLRLTNTAASSGNLNVRKGVTPPAYRALLGDLTVSLAGSTVTVWVGPFEVARHAQADGSINIDFDSTVTGTVTAFLVPRSDF